MQDGLYKAEFRGPFGSGSGVVVLKGTSFLGGDAGLAYAGTLLGEGDRYEAKLRTRRHTATGAGSVLGGDEVEVTLHGQATSETEITLSSPVPGSSQSFQARLVKLQF